MKIKEGEFDEMTARDGIIQAPHMARNKWVSITTRKALKPTEWEHYLRQSYDLIRSKLPKKVQQSL